MFPAVRQTDIVISTCNNIPSGIVETGSPRYYIDGLPGARLSDLTTPGPILSGSSNYFIDGLPATRLIDSVACGVITTASNNHFYS